MSRPRHRSPMAACSGHAPVPPVASRALWLRAAGCLAAVALLSACASHGPSIGANGQAARYAAEAHGDYAPPGPPNDPWGPYIQAASQRFDVPPAWIRAVMHVESGGHEYLNGQLTTSPAGAMGLMQVMPDTYRDLQAQYNLGNDPYNPRDNIMAGTAYLREMYDIYGAPGFLAAYNAGPRRLDDYLANERPLPAETRRYVAMIAPAIEGVAPLHASPAAAYAMNRLPIDIPPGLRYGSGGQYREYRMASNQPLPPPAPAPFRPVVTAAPLPEPVRARPVVRPQVAMLVPPSRLPVPPRYHRVGFRLIPSAQAEPLPAPRMTGLAGSWAVQVGAFYTAAQASHAAGEARHMAPAMLAEARPAVSTVHRAQVTLWRARLTGLSRGAAVQACADLSRHRTACIVLSPEAQS